MAGRRFLIAVPVTAGALAGCGVATHALTSTTSQHLASVMSPDAAHALPAATPTPTPAPVQHYVVLATPAAAGLTDLSIRSASGTVIAETAARQTESWSHAAGAEGVYWLDDGTVERLALNGSVSVVAHIPAEVDQFVISPDGESFAYTTSLPQTKDSDVLVNTIYVEQFGGSPEIVGQRLSDPNHPSADAPLNWQYYLDSWTEQGIVFARGNTGGCGCGAFDMQMLSQYTGILNPAQNSVIDLTSDAQCPLSAVAPRSLMTACFEGTSASTALYVRSDGTTVQQLTLSGKNSAGDGLFSDDGTLFAYATIPAGEFGGCGAPMPPTALHVLTLGSGNVIGAYIADGFAPQAWMPDGDIYGTTITNSSSSIVAVDPTTLHVTTLWSGASGAGVVGTI